MTEQTKTEKGIWAWARRLAKGDDLILEQIIWDRRFGERRTDAMVERLGRINEEWEG
jgi:hypothetical protein